MNTYLARNIFKQGINAANLSSQEEKQFKLHIRSFEINSFKEFKLPRTASALMKFTQEMHQSYFSDHFQYLLNFLPNKIENLSSWMSEVVLLNAHKGKDSGVGERYM